MGGLRGNISIKGLTAGYGGQALCAPLSLDIGAGQGVGIIGANGSGKSTVLRAMFDLQLPLAGSVSLDGVKLDESSLSFRRDVALLVEDGAFFDELSVTEHLALVARGHRLPHPEQAVAKELEFFGLEAVADSLPQQLSSGQRRKLMLAACLIRLARFLVLDEPEQRLDPGIRRRLAERLASRRREGAALVLVSHDAKIIGHCADSVLLLEEGRWRRLEAPQAVAWLAGE